MDMSLFTSLEGRINRQKWWLGTIVLIIVYLIFYVIVMMAIGGSMMASFDLTAGPDAMMAMMRRAAIGQIVLFIIFIYPSIALMKKRLNDRDRPVWYIYVFWAPAVISMLLGISGMAQTMTDVGGGVMMPAPNTLGWIVNLAGLVVGIWALVELGFLKGTAGSNQHGPDPLAS